LSFELLHDETKFAANQPINQNNTNKTLFASKILVRQQDGQKAKFFKNKFVEIIDRTNDNADVKSNIHIKGSKIHLMKKQVTRLKGFVKLALNLKYPILSQVVSQNHCKCLNFN